jgi:hypothetical protein
MFMPLAEGVQDRDASGRRIDAARDPPDVEAQLRAAPAGSVGADASWHCPSRTESTSYIVQAMPTRCTALRGGWATIPLGCSIRRLSSNLLSLSRLPTQGGQSGEACPAAPIFSEGSW